MTAKSRSRGHLIYYNNKSWRYKNTGLFFDDSRPCIKCGKYPGDGGLDPCLISLITALNKAGLKTIASCCGHGWRPGNIVLEDDREILIARNYEEARKMEKVISIDINGDKL